MTDPMDEPLEEILKRACSDFDASKRECARALCHDLTHSVRFAVARALTCAVSAAYERAAKVLDDRVAGFIARGWPRDSQVIVENIGNAIAIRALDEGLQPAEQQQDQKYDQNQS